MQSTCLRQHHPARVAHAGARAIEREVLQRAVVAQRLRQHHPARAAHIACGGDRVSSPSQSPSSSPDLSDGELLLADAGVQVAGGDDQRDRFQQLAPSLLMDLGRGSLFVCVLLCNIVTRTK